MSKSPLTFLDFSILSQHDPKEDQDKLLQTVTAFFSRVIYVKEQVFRDDVGHLHRRLELKTNRDLTTFISLWTFHFEFLLHTVPKYLKGVQPVKVTGRSRSPYVILKLETNSGALSHLFLNLTNFVLPLIKISIYFEEVLDGIVIIVKEEKDFRYFLADPLDEAIAKQFYNELGITDESFFVERKQYIASKVRGFLVKGN
jgi:hypothetical protein